MHTSLCELEKDTLKDGKLFSDAFDPLMNWLLTNKDCKGEDTTDTAERDKEVFSDRIAAVASDLKNYVDMTMDKLYKVQTHRT